MPTDHSLGELNARLVLIGAALGDVCLKAHRRIANHAKYDNVPEALAPDTGNDQRLSRYGRGARRGSIRLTARYTVTDKAARITPQPAGPWALLEQGSHKDHWFTPSARSAKARRGRAGARRVVLVDGQPFAYARHGPLAARHTWTHVREHVARDAPGIVNTEVNRALKKVLG